MKSWANPTKMAPERRFLLEVSFYTISSVLYDLILVSAGAVSSDGARLGCWIGATEGAVWSFRDCLDRA